MRNIGFGNIIDTFIYLTNYNYIYLKCGNNNAFILLIDYNYIYLSQVKIKRYKHIHEVQATKILVFYNLINEFNRNSSTCPAMYFPAPSGKVMLKISIVMMHG